METLVLVDQDLQRLQAFRRALRLEFDVRTAENASQALKLIAAVTAQVVVTASRLKDMTGVELLEKIQGQYPEVQRILIAGASRGHVSSALDSGAITQVVPASIRPTELAVAIRGGTGDLSYRPEE